MLIQADSPVYYHVSAGQHSTEGRGKGRGKGGEREEKGREREEGEGKGRVEERRGKKG